MQELEKLLGFHFNFDVLFFIWFFSIINVWKFYNEFDPKILNFSFWPNIYSVSCEPNRPKFSLTKADPTSSESLAAAVTTKQIDGIIFISFQTSNSPLKVF